MIATIGYQDRTIGEFIDVLKRHEISMLIDVRELPLSRRKGFSKTNLSGELADAGILYRHVREAGNPYRKLATKPSLAAYDEYLSRNPSALDEITRLTNPTADGDARVALMCFEKDPATCHRSRLAARFGEYGTDLA